jgi:hypothetical protein
MGALYVPWASVPTLQRQKARYWAALDSKPMYGTPMKNALDINWLHNESTTNLDSQSVVSTTQGVI